jgi:hypothetical protein
LERLAAAPPGAAPAAALPELDALDVLELEPQATRTSAVATMVVARITSRSLRK